MNRDQLRPVAIALLCVVAIGVAAATLNTAVDTGPGEPEAGDPGSTESDTGVLSPLNVNLSDANESGGPGGGHLGLALCVSFLRRPSVVLALLVGLGLVLLPVYRRVGVVGAAGVGLSVLLPGLVVYAFLTTCSSRPPRPLALGFATGRNNSSLGLPGGGGSGGGGAVATALDPPVLVLLVAGLLGAVLLAAFVRSTDDDPAEEPEAFEPEEPDEEALAAIGAAAGDAADRIETEAVLENEVYRAWREMTGLLAVPNPSASTPAEFARAATVAGMNPGHVEALTDLFREVRYGGEPATDERERRAVEALRLIEDAYADGEEAE